MNRIATAAALLAAIVQVESLRAECEAGARNLPTTVSSGERAAVEAAAGRPVDHIACGRLGRGIDLASESVSQVVDAHVGYIALTDKAVLFVSNERRTMLPGLYRRTIVFQARFEDISSIGVHRPSGWDTNLQLLVRRETSLVQVAQGRNGDNLLDALRTRLIAACSGALVTPSGVTCP